MSRHTAYVYLEKKPANALDLHELILLYRQLRMLQRDKRCRVIVIKSRSVHIFSSGLDLKSMIRPGRWNTAMQVLRAERMVGKIVRLICRSSVIYIAQLHAGVIGSAASIALACDFCIADETAWFWLPDPVYGGLLADGGMKLARDHAGVAGAKMLCMTGMRFCVSQAAEMGLVAKTATKDGLCATVEKLASRLAALSPVTLAQSKACLTPKGRGCLPYLRLLRILSSKEMHQRLQQYLSKPARSPK